MRLGMTQEELAVKSGHWPLYRYDPRRRDEGQNPLQAVRAHGAHAIRSRRHRRSRRDLMGSIVS